MEHTVDQLQHQIGMYRRLLREGTFSQNADAYLRRIFEAEEQLRQLTAKYTMSAVDEGVRS